MSSEETVSLVGSEVMPLDYGSMDSESSPSPSSLEKTVVGVRGDEVVEVRGNEMVGVEGDSVLITVVEVEGRGERGYEIDADIVEEVKQYRSELGTKDSLGHLVENYEISSRVLVKPAGVEEKACSAPRDHWMPVYAHYLIAGLRFPIPELLVGLLLDYGIGLTQLVPNAMRGGSRKDKGWYYFTPRVANKESRALFTVGPSSIKGWKEKFFFVDDTEWERGNAEVRDAQCIEAAKLYGPSTLSEAEMDKFLNTAGGVAIPKKPRKKSKTSTKQVDEERVGKEVVPTTSAEADEEVPQLKRKGWEERRALQKKKKLEEGAEVQAPGKGKGPIPLMAFQSSLFEAKNMTGASWFINTTFPEVDKRNARDEALRYCGASVVKHVLESASWVNGLAQEFMDSVKERSLLQRQSEMDKFLNTAGGVAIPKKPRKKSKTSTKQVDKGRVGKKVVLTTSAEAEEEVPQLKRKGWEERRALQKKKKLEEGAEVQAPGKGKGPIPPMAFQSSLFEAKNMTGARWFINTTFPEVDKRNTRDEALRYCGASVVKHVLASVSWVNGLAQEFMDSVKERSLLQRQISESEREAQAKEIVLIKDAFVELKENVQMLVHNGMKEHISNFISSSSFDNIVNLYRLPTAIIAFTNYRKKVKAEYLEVDITKITFGEQEEGVEEDGESMSADFCPQIKLRWEHDADGRVVFPPQFDFEFVVVEEEGAEVEEDEVEAGVEGTEMDESQPIPEVEIHPVPFDDEQPPLPDEQQPTQPPLPAEQEPVEPPLPAEE
ncbi:hypothetical protein SLEP1_g28687 [Rubroshorea leprosula]|uniref:Uncharacterized protein n=1 Tax=Rubroshorea leprosula TaxID=152421 RepID=A0AAV5JX34_9ROSI|nr:hypothetical protein SLEP1_g28687 [Rubroshorea leprosula]